MKNYKSISRILIYIILTWTSQNQKGFALSKFMLSGLIIDVKGENKVMEVKWEGSTNVFKLFSVLNEDDIPEYYYADLKADDDGKMSVRVYWDIWGNYLKIGLKDNISLKKTNGETFSLKEMNKLHMLLNNENADIKYYQMSDLSSKEAESTYYSVDATSGATVVEGSYQCIDGGIKLCYNLWNVVHGNVNEAIKKATLQVFNSKSDAFQQKNKDLYFFVRKIQNNQKITSSEISNLKVLANNSLISFSSFIYEMKQSSINKDDINIKLNAFLLNDNSELVHLVIYNFLNYNEFHSKELRQYKVGFKRME